MEMLFVFITQKKVHKLNQFSNVFLFFYFSIPFPPKKNNIITSTQMVNFLKLVPRLHHILCFQVEGSELLELVRLNKGGIRCLELVNVRGSLDLAGIAAACPNLSVLQVPMLQNVVLMGNINGNG